MPIRQHLFGVRFSQKTDVGQVTFANSITLTPGTLTVEVTPDGVFYVHWLNVLSEKDEEAAEHVLRRFEWFIKRIFE
jgi:multicomponent Na+:H+ antiporter subunit E